MYSLVFRSKRLSQRNFSLALSLTIAISAFAGIPSAFGAEESSLDSIWMDQGADKAAKSPVPGETATPSGKDRAFSGTTPTSTSASTTPSTTASTSSSDALDTAAPMCKLDAFKNSALVSKGGWPGVGPFKTTADGEFADDRNNKLRLDLTGDQITRAEMVLANKKLSGTVPKDLIDVEMHVDFLLEAVGLKPKRIQDLNAQLTQNKAALFRTDAPTLNLTTGRYYVSLEKRQNEASGNTDLVVAVNSLDADKRIIRQHSAPENGTTALVPIPTSTRLLNPPTKLPPDKPPSTSVKPPATSTPLANSTAGPLKEQFAALIGNWQKIKKVAVRNRDAAELQVVLSGKALVRQTDAVKWLTSNHKYYDMNPKGVVIDQFTEISPARKYMVAAQVREAYKFIDEPTGKVLKEVDDVNKVNYTIEKLGNKWVITDSALLSTATKPTDKSH